MRYSVLLEPDKEEGGFVVTFPAFPDLATQGESFEQALERAREALVLHIRGMIQDGEEVPVEHGLPLLATVDVEVPSPATV